MDESEMKRIEARNQERRVIVSKQMNDVKDYLKATYGEIKPEWAILLNQLQDHLTIYYKVKDELIDAPMLTEKGNKNPLLTVIKDETSIINSLVQKLGISPWDSSKIKQTPEDDSDEYMDSLTKPHPQLALEFPA